MRIKAHVLTAFVLLALFCSPLLSSAGAADADRVREILEKECVNLKKDTLFYLLRTGFTREFEKGLEPELLKIIEGVVKRTDFDGMPEEKAYGIIKLVYGAYKKGAPLEYLDQIFDVAYTKDVSVEQLFAAANALRELHDSEVPQDIYEEFVYHSMEEKWEPSALPVLTKGLIYGVDRGLTPQRVALAIIVDVDQDGLKKKGASSLVSEAIKSVRDIEPGKWREAGNAEKNMMKRMEEGKDLERLKQEAEAVKRLQERLEQQRAETGAKAGIEKDRRQKAEQERIAGELEDARRRNAEMTRRYQEGQKELLRKSEKDAQELEIERQRKRAEREERRKREFDVLERQAVEHGRHGAMDTGRFYSAVDSSIGIPYRFGGDSDSGIDCSAFTRRVYRSVGLELPRTANQQARMGSAVAGERLEAGDLVFFDTSIMGAISHVGVYLDNGTFAHASKSRGVTKSSLRERYYYKRYVKANRIFTQ